MPQRLLPKQEELLRSPAKIIGVFGGWRSGKTTGCALKFISNCLANPWTPDYGEDYPFSLVIGLTHKVMVDSAYRELRRLLPKDAVLFEKKGEDWHMQLINGHVIKFRTAGGSIEGASACGVWLDEAHLLRDEEVYLNYQMRASDARGRRFLVLVSGLPESGWLQDTFDRPEHRDNPARATFFFRTQDNTYNPRHVMAEFRQSASKKNSIQKLDGQWMQKEGVIYYEFDARIHVISDPGDRAQPVHLGCDIGNQGAIVFVQEKQVMMKNADGSTKTNMGRPVYSLGLHVVDEMLPDDMSTEAAMREAQKRGWRIDPARSIIFIDPTTRRDEIASIRRVLGDNIRIIKKERGDLAENVEYGHDCVNAALCDVDGNVRLTISNKLPRMQRSLLSVITRYHRGPTGRPVRDDKVDHVLDAFRYPVAHLLPIRRTEGYGITAA